MDSLPFKITMGIIIIELVGFVFLCIDSFPPPGGVSTILISWVLILDYTLHYGKHCLVYFGDCFQKNDKTHQQTCFPYAKRVVYVSAPVTTVKVIQVLIPQFRKVCQLPETYRGIIYRVIYASGGLFQS